MLPTRNIYKYSLYQRLLVRRSGSKALLTFIENTPAQPSRTASARRVCRRLSLIVSGLVIFILSGFDAINVLGQSGMVKAPSGANNQSGNNFNPPEFSLVELWRQVETNHPKLRGAIVKRQMTEAKLLEKRGSFDPVIASTSEFLRYNSTSTPGKPSLALQNQLNAEWTTRSGIKMFAGARFNYGRVKSPLSSTGEAGEYFAGMAVPLRRGRGVNAKSIGELQTIAEIDAAETNVSAVRLDLLRDAAIAYWDWAAAKRKLDINRNIFEISKERARQIAVRVSNGDLAPIDSTEAAMEVQRRIGSVVKAEQELQKAGIKLRLFLWDASGNQLPEPEADRAPPDFAAPNRLPDFVVSEGIKRARDAHPELRGLDYRREQTRLSEKLAINNRKTRVDLYVAPGRDTGFNGIGTTFKFGATIEIPVRTREADGQLAAARLEARKIELDQRYLLGAIESDITTAAQAVNAAHDRYLLATQELKLARDLEQGERTRFAAGDSTLFLVNQRERAAAEAEIKLIEIHFEYEAALAAFRIATLEI